MSTTSDLGFVSGPIGNLAFDAVPQTFAPGVLQLDLIGQVGPDKPISLAGIQRRLATDFCHLHIRIMSTGGNSDEGLRIYEYLRALPQPISVIARGQCYSAALDVLAAGSYRLATSDCVLLLHPTSRSRDSLPERVTSDSLNRAAMDLAKTDGRIVDLLHARTGFDRDFFATEILTEDPLSVAQALVCGLVHEVEGLSEQVDPNWPEIIKSLPTGLHIAPRLRTANYLAACATAASLYGRSSARP
ncbi:MULTISPECIES: ATP-dependent Clp protease proteolytic subunit [Bradyrhizobium]|uniref:ATP-dependent Clp protease proteolytic subunit n=1 Tax=Bradyrhizobium elkanii TaxID=29448 RepID=UPI00271554A2|nr:ATP-dependent Clp protease proteolytic subunit [Bradyrhizobium elkanii]WLB84903.1 ATP-dependent Clp protease proteolytic subunit [Bradyrhizobium elkanii]